MAQLDFTPTATCRDFMVSEKRVRFLIGAVGSSKTTTCLYEILRRAAQQAPADDGKRYTRFAIIRNTLAAIKSTVLKDIQQIFGPIIDYRVSESTVYIRQGDIDCEILLIPLDTPDDQKRLLSSQLTGAYFNEFVEVDPVFISGALGRCGRYPSQLRGKPTWYGVFADSNPGTEDSPYYEILKVALPETYGYFEQPSPLINDEDDEVSENPLAENIANLPGGFEYYWTLLNGASPEWAERFVFGQWGESLSGQAVFKNTFNDKFHVADGPLTPSTGHALIIGMDFARAPAAVIMQIDHTGRLLVLQELWEENMGVEKFIRDRLIPVMYSPRFQSRPSYIVGDPSGRQRSQIGERSVFSMINGLGFEAVPAQTNHIKPRLDAVEKWLLMQREGKAAVLFDPVGCPDLILAMKHKYRYRARKDGELEDKPHKIRPWADLADAFQYGCLGTAQNLMGRVMRKMQRSNVPKAAISSSAWT
jgi:hypothetical protein